MKNEMLVLFVLLLGIIGCKDKPTVNRLDAPHHKSKPTPVFTFRRKAIKVSGSKIGKM